MTAHTLPDDPNYCFCPSYDLGDEPQQIRIVFESHGGLCAHGPRSFNHQLRATTRW